LLKCCSTGAQAVMQVRAQTVLKWCSSGDASVPKWSLLKQCSSDVQMDASGDSRGDSSGAQAVLRWSSSGAQVVPKWCAVVKWCPSGAQGTRKWCPSGPQMVPKQSSCSVQW